MIGDVFPVEFSSLLYLVDRYGDDAPLKRIFQMILSQDCKTVVEEQEYKDDEYYSEWEHLYKHSFKKYPETTVRLHFFSSPFTKDDAPNLSSYGAEYLGFCVLRPFLRQRVAYAIIKPIADINEQRHKRRFLLCQDTFDVTIKVSDTNTQCLTITGAPFIQQDGLVGRCAHVALAMADQLLAKQSMEGRKPCTVAKIAEIISSVPGLGRKTPSPGLTAIEISEALSSKDMGYSPVIYCYTKETKTSHSPESVIYRYLESKIPIVLSVPIRNTRHALTVIGHSFEPEMWWALAQTEYYELERSGSGGHYRSSTDWIPHLIINDDNFGPYLTIPMEYIRSVAKQNLIIAVPLPRHINIQGEDAEEYAHKLVTKEFILEWMRYYTPRLTGKNTERLQKAFFRHLKKKDLVLRTCLVSSDQFKKEYAAPYLKGFYDKIDMPDKIWFTEVSIPELFCEMRLRLGEVIMDPTGTPFSHYFLAMHLPGIFIRRDLTTETWPRIPIADDIPFTHIIR